MQFIYTFTRWPLVFLAMLTLGFSMKAEAQEESGEPVTSTAFDRIWSAPVLYENDDNPTVQSFSLIGRYHGQYWAVRADQGDAQDWENRRMIAGFSSKWFKDFKLEAQAYLKSGSGSIYDGLYEAYVRWSPSQMNLSLTMGRMDYLFTGFERSKSSKVINAVERGLLVNQIMPAEVVGAHLRGTQGEFSYQVGLFSRTIEEEFSDFDTGAAGMIGVAYKTGALLEEGSVHLDYLYNSRKTEGNAFRPYRHIASLWYKGESGRMGLGIDLTAALPHESDGHVWGLTLEPTWVLLHELLGNNDPLQFVLRYQFATSNEDNGLHLQRRYEEKVTMGEGNNYHALYTGLNYYIYGQKLKLMLGGEYARMKDDATDGGEYKGWTWFGAIRTYF